MDSGGRMNVLGTPMHQVFAVEVRTTSSVHRSGPEFFTGVFAL